MRPPSPFDLMWLLFAGFALSLAYGLCSTVLVYAVSGPPDAQQFLTMYIGPFNTLISLGIIVATTLIVRRSQHIIPQAIEQAFLKSDLSRTEFSENKQRYYSLRRTVNFGAQLFFISFLILYCCRFPLSGLAEALMMIAGCAQWALASYVGRKLRYAAMMLHSLRSVPVDRNLFKNRALDSISTTVHIASTLTIIFVYIHVRSHYDAPFLYNSFIGSSAQVFLLLPALLATPVLLILNFFPREVLRRIYAKSIDFEVQSLRGLAKGNSLSPFERELRLLELRNMQREELRYSLQLTLSDLPIGITILIMVAEPIIRH